MISGNDNTSSVLIVAFSMQSVLQVHTGVASLATIALPTQIPLLLMRYSVLV